MSEKFKEPKARRLGTRPLITAGFVGALMLGMIVITPAGSGLFAPDRLDGSDVGKLKQDIAYCRVPDGSLHRLGRVASGRVEPWNARRATGGLSG